MVSCTQVLSHSPLLMVSMVASAVSSIAAMSGANLATMGAEQELFLAFCVKVMQAVGQALRKPCFALSCAMHASDSEISVGSAARHSSSGSSAGHVLSTSTEYIALHAGIGGWGGGGFSGGGLGGRGGWDGGAAGGGDGGGFRRNSCNERWDELDLD